jgi:hypothetical protein
MDKSSSLEQLNFVFALGWKNKVIPTLWGRSQEDFTIPNRTLK